MILVRFKECNIQKQFNEGSMVGTTDFEAIGYI